MMTKRLKLIFFILFFGLATFIKAAASIEALLKEKISNIISIDKIKSTDHFQEVFEIILKQQLDHNNPALGTFEQRVFLSHVNRKKPMLYVTEGYNANQRTYELAKMMRSNQLIVEYRFFGKSKPLKLDWELLKNDQAMEDLHSIKEAFDDIYKKKWISTGISKGGTTCLMYKAKHPKDVKVAIPYVAPLANTQIDRRTDEHILSIGTKECRSTLAEFQKSALKQRVEVISLIEDFAIENNIQYTYLSIPRVLDYAVAEFTFSFWQWGYKCDQVPGNPTPKEIFDLINRVVSFDFYSDVSYQQYLPAFYQFITENGYYGFITDHISDLLLAEPNPSNIIFAPQNTSLDFNPYCQDVIDFLDKKGKKVMYIYGENDPWTACGYIPKKGIKALRMSKKGGSHLTRISSFSEDDQKLIYKTLKRWAHVKLYRI